MQIHIIYTLVIVIWGLLVDFNRKNCKKRYVIGVSLILITVSGLRNMYVGPDDTYYYYLDFLDYGKTEFGDLALLNKDPFFAVFTKILRFFINDNFQLYLILCSAFLIIPLGQFIYRESKNPMMSYLMFISLGFFYFSMVCIRQSMAIGILLLSYQALKNHDFWKFICFVLIASAFHLTALLFFVIYPLSYLKYNFKLLFFYIAAMVVAIELGQSLISSFDLTLLGDRFASYQFGENRSLSAAGFLQLVLFALLFVLYYSKVKMVDEVEINLQSHLLSLAMIFQSLVFVIAEFFRLSWYFKVYILILIPLIAYYSGRRQLYSAILGFAFLLYFFMNEANNDYAFFWQHYTPKF